ncbi:MAG: hypothetical protein M3548_19940 [Actinomycetota bacterium]|nr:hypothetical protein [Actinomycetota bacterium]
MLGFEVTYRQMRPNPYLALRREDINLQFFDRDDYDPAQSYSTCIIIVPDIHALFEEFAAAMRKARGKLLISGIPRVTRPRLRNDRYTGFAVIDPGGNWIRITRAQPEPEAATRLAKAMENVARMADSHGDDRQGLKTLEGAPKKAVGDEPEFQAATEYWDELVERIRGSTSRPGVWARSGPPRGRRSSTTAVARSAGNRLARLCVNLGFDLRYRSEEKAVDVTASVRVNRECVQGGQQHINVANAPKARRHVIYPRKRVDAGQPVMLSLFRWIAIGGVWSGLANAFVPDLPRPLAFKPAQ